MLKEKFKKLGALLPALGVLILTWLSQFTMSWSKVSLESTDVALITNVLSWWFASVLLNVVRLWWIIAMITFAWILIRKLKKRFRAKF